MTHRRLNNIDSTMPNILVADDELNMRLVLQALLTREGYEVFLAEDGREALQIIKSQNISTVITDLKMPHLDGKALLEWVRANRPALPVIIITAYGTVASAVEAVKKGAFDYITKPFELEEIRAVLDKALKTAALEEGELGETPDVTGPGLIASSRAMEEIYEGIRRVAPTSTTVLITGETGTGKELIAKAIHLASPRRNNPFIKINCAAIPPNLLESELFGYEKGAFTGANLKKQGKIEIAHKGTLFLDEIGELPKEMQVKLLRVIQEKEFERIGGLRTIKVDVRLLAATNRDLPREVKKGTFREDLFYRLNIFPLNLPPLRDRKEDIAPLAEYFLERFNKKLSRRIEALDEEVLALFKRYPWPGNVRELENILERLILIARDDRIVIDDIPPGMKEAAAASEAEGRGFKDVLREHLEDLERQKIAQSLEDQGGNVTRAAKQLGISRKGLQMKMIKYNLRRQER